MRSALREKLNDWNALRNQQDNIGRNNNIGRIPLIGFLLRTLSRIRNLGKMLNKEYAIWQAVLDEFTDPQSTTHSLSYNKLELLLAEAGIKVVPITLEDNLHFELVIKNAVLFDGKPDPVVQNILNGHYHTSDAYTLCYEIAKRIPNCRVIDVGAHIGTFALPMAALNCQVVAIEASPNNANMLSLSKKLNGFDNLTVIQAVADSHIGRKKFMSSGPFGQVSELTSDHPATTDEFAATTIDQVAEDMDWDHVDLIKIDVEGWESNVFEGMTTLMSGPNPPIIVYESNAIVLRLSRNQLPSALTDILSQNGYNNYFVDDNQLIEITPDFIQVIAVGDNLAAKPSHHIESTLTQIPPWQISGGLKNEDIIRHIDAQAKIAIGLNVELFQDQLLYTLDLMPQPIRNNPHTVEIYNKLNEIVAHRNVQ